MALEICHDSKEKQETTHTDRIELPNPDKIRTLREKEPYKYLGILEADTIKQVKIKDKIKKEYPKKTRKLHETKLYCRKLFLRKILRTFLEVDQRTQKLMTMPKALHPRDDVDRLYLEGERGLTIIEDSVDSSVQRLE